VIAKGPKPVSETDTAEPTRRDILYIATGAAGAVGVAAFAWPFIHQMNPDASTRALATVEIDISSVETGRSLVVKWQGKPIFIRNRTKKEIDEANSVPLEDLKDKIARNKNLKNASADASDANRVVAGKENWLIQVGICTHLGCIPIGEQGDFDGWFCPCHGSHYDTSGRIRSGPAPENLLVPPYEFLTDTLVKIG